MRSIQLCLDPMGSAINSYRYNFMGGMLPFGLGVLMANCETARIKNEEYRTWQWCIWLVVFSLFVVGFSCSLIGWTFAPIVVIGACLAMAKVIKNIPYLGAAMLWMGDISAALFVSHPITRKIFIPISRQGDMWTGLLMYIIASLFVAMLFREIMKKIKFA